MRAKTESQNKMIGRALGTALVAQQAPSQLTLEEAISIAKQNSPMYLSTSNDMLTCPPLRRHDLY